MTDTPRAFRQQPSSAWEAPKDLELVGEGRTGR